MFVKLLSILVLLIVAWFIIKWRLQKRRRKNTIAFFHLFCSSGGGGERVLWHTIEALFRKYPNYTIYIYSHKNVQEDTLRILLKVRELFKIDLITDRRLIDKLEFVPLKYSSLIEAKHYPFLTLLFQNIGSILLACEAAYRMVPEIYIESIGFTFTLPIFKLHKCTVITYVHYPTISNDMIRNVQTSTHAAFNNRAIFVKNPILRQVKLNYYRVLAYLYGLVGRQADLVMVNSSWTQNHIESLWDCKAHVVYPPCDVESFRTLERTRPWSKTSALNIISIAQFRPEKNHELQLEAFDMFLEKTGARDSRLTLYGGCRDDEDRKRVKKLEDLCHSLNLLPQVDIVVGAPFGELLAGLQNADVAIHTMENEHFGIVLLECMAAGLITVAHNSGGPKTDIIDNNKNGYLANDVEDFASKLAAISKMSYDERQKIRENALRKSDQFSTGKFEERFINLVDEYLSKGR